MVHLCSILNAMDDARTRARVALVVAVAFAFLATAILGMGFIVQRLWALLLAFVIVPFLAYVFAWFFPGVWERLWWSITPSGPVSVDAGFDHFALAEGWAVALDN